MFELYNEMIAAYKSGDRSKFITAARKWFQACEENPFKVDTEAHDAFFQADYHFGQWTNGGINSRVSKIRFIEQLERLAALDVINPHTKVESVPGEKIKFKTRAHMTGIVPEPKMGDVRVGGWAISSDTIVQDEAARRIVEKEEEKPEEPKKGLFGRSKKR